jgi:hypothetical protein
MCSRWKREQDLSRFTVFYREGQAGYKPDKWQASVLLEQSSNGPKAGQEARWLQGFRAFMLCEKQRSTGSSESLELVLLMGRQVDCLCLHKELLK